jgi:CheY-like chemotaxis protein
LVRGLSLDGFRVTTATTGAAGLELARAHAFDVVVVDLHLPDINGLTVVERLRGCGVAGSIVAITGCYLDPEMPQHARAAGATAFQYKPLWLDNLPGLLRELVASGVSPTAARSASAMEGAPPVDGSGPREMLVGRLLAGLDRLAFGVDEPTSGRDMLLGVLLSALSDASLSLSTFRACADALRATVTAPSEVRAADLAARARDGLRAATRNSMRARHPAVREVLATLLEKPRWREEEDLAREIGLSRGHFARLVHEELGIDYRTLRQLAVMKASVVEILTSGEQVAQIAHRHDMTPGWFDDVFASVFGSCPRELRRLSIRLRR